MLKKYFKVMPYLVLALFTSAFLAIMLGFTTINMMKLLDLALGGEIAEVKKKAPGLILQASSLVPVGIMSAIMNNLYKRKANIIMKNYYIRKVFGKNIAEFQKENNAKYISAMTNDFNTLEGNLITAIYTVCNGIVNFLVGMWILSKVDVRMMLLAILVIIVNLIISFITSKPTKKAYKERSDLFDLFTSHIKEILSAFHIVKNYNLQDKVIEDYNQKSEEIQQKGFLIERMLSFIFCSQNFIVLTTFYSVISVVGYFAVVGKITPGGLLLVVEGISKMMEPIFQISENLPKLFTTKNLIHKIEQTLDNSNAYVETVDLPELSQGFEFKDVAFHYEDDEQLILSKVNLKVEKNGKYLIVGPSGGGKSTLLKLFRKYFNPTSGQILIDGYDLKDVKKDHYFKLVASIEQQVFIFEDTIRNNITLYKDYSEEEINAAIEASGLSDFVKQKSEGLNAIIYDNGKNISGGEKSRIVIARALLNKASILFMDEAFASLDMERAREIEKTILGLKDITVINVSHVIFKDTKELYDKVITVKGCIW